MVECITRTIIVTGGAQGIGRGITEYLLQHQARVVIADIDEEAGEETITRLNQPERVMFVATDVGDEKSVMHCIRAARNFSDNLHGLVNNAGIARPGNTPLTNLSLYDWEKMLRTNLTGAFLMVKHSVEHLKKTRGAVVNIASTRAIQSEANTEAYSASKGGLVSLTHAMAVSLAGLVRVNTILPGWIDVRHLKKGSGPPPASLSRLDHEQHPAGRVGCVDDIAAMAAFLLSEEAGFITGQQFIVDGGMTRKMIYAE